MPRNAKRHTFYCKNSPVQIHQEVNIRVGFGCSELYMGCGSLDAKTGLPRQESWKKEFPAIGIVHNRSWGKLRPYSAYFRY